MSQIPIIQQATKYDERIAFCQGTNQRTYRALLDGSEAIASALLNSSEDLNEQRVAFLLPAGADYVQTQWGIWRAGGIAVPLSLSATERELKYTLKDADCSCIITTSELVSKISSFGLRHLLIEETDRSTKVSLPQVTPKRRAMILYTSGTTSSPKGVVTTHQCIQAQIEALVQAWHWQKDDRIPLFLPLHHIHGIINVMSCALWSGAEIEPFPRFDLDAILQRVSENAYTVFMAVPTIYVKLIQALESMPEEIRTPILAGFRSMRLMVSGSAALPASVHQTWTRLTGQELLERYGMTEIGMALSNPYEGERRPGAVGRALPGVEIRLRSEQGKIITSEDEAGEIQVRGPNVFLEYWNRPEATQEAFQEGWFCTGDVAILKSGYYHILGRSSIDIIKSGGYKLSALEIEATLLDHPAIEQCAVVGVSEETWGEIVAAAVVLNDGETLTLEALREWCRERISSYRIPRRLLTLEELPRNAMGKVTKPDVQELFEEGDSGTGP